MEMEVFLPTEIIIEILTRLPADSTIRCRGICKQWRSLIDHPSFREAHTRQVISSSPSNPKKFGNYIVPNSSASSSGFFLHVKHDGHIYKLEVMEYDDGRSGDEKSVLWFKQTKPITDNPFQFIYGTWDVLNISSCNGLVLMSSSSIIPNYSYNNDMFICNPFTREYVNIRTAAVTPQVTGEKRWLGGYMAYGFGYHPCTNEYKVVSIFYEDGFPEGKKNKGMVSVYTLGSGKWRNKGEIPYLVYNSTRSSAVSKKNSSRSSLFANGAIHWLTSTGKQIVSFDLADEEFRVVVPLLRPPSPSYGDQYGVLGGCLCVAAECESSRDIWVLNVCTTNNNKEFSWNKKFSIPWKDSTSGSAEPQLVTKSGKILLSCVGRPGCILVSYDPKASAFVYGNIFSRSGGKLITYTKSFVSLKALGEEDVKSWRSVAHAQALAQQQQ